MQWSRMDFDIFLNAIHTQIDPKRLSPEQIDTIIYTSGPMWIVAGHGPARPRSWPSESSRVFDYYLEY